MDTPQLRFVDSWAPRDPEQRQLFIHDFKMVLIYAGETYRKLMEEFIAVNVRPIYLTRLCPAPSPTSEPALPVDTSPMPASPEPTQSSVRTPEPSE